MVSEYRACQSTAGCCGSMAVYRLRPWGVDEWTYSCGRHLAAMTQHAAGDFGSHVITAVL